MRKLSLKSEGGYTLLECLMAVGMLGLLMPPLLGSILTQVTENKEDLQRERASVATQFILDDLRGYEVATLPSTGSDSPVPVTIDGKNYEVTVSYCLDNTHCNSYSRHLTAVTTFNGKQFYEVETIFTTFE